MREGVVSGFTDQGIPVASVEPGRKKVCLNILLWFECPSKFIR